MRTAVPAVAALLLAACSQAPQADPNFAASVEQWQADRVARLKADDGWLTLVGLFWIEQGVSTVGSNPGSDVPLPETLPAKVGTVTLKGSEALFTPAAGVPLQATALHGDATPNYEVLTLGTVSFYLIERGGRYGIRVKDTQSPARVNFAGLEWYPPDPTWAVDAKLTPAPHHVSFQTDAGVTEEADSPGYLEFDRSGQHFKLETVAEDGELFTVIRDATSGKTTYAASRFIYSAMPDKNGMTRLDFNRAYNPPCVFTEFATCPLPPPMNRMTVAIEAGEKKYVAAGH